MADGKVATLFDGAKYNAGFYRNCYPGTREVLNVAAIFDDDESCYGWSNWSYVDGKGWRNKDRELSRGRYLVHVSVSSAGEQVTAILQLENSASRPAFRLLPATKRDRALLAPVRSKKEA